MIVRSKVVCITSRLQCDNNRDGTYRKDGKNEHSTVPKDISAHLKCRVSVELLHQRKISLISTRNYLVSGEELMKKLGIDLPKD